MKIGIYLNIFKLQELQSEIHFQYIVTIILLTFNNYIKFISLYIYYYCIYPIYNINIIIIFNIK